jgi:hypothetical protein
MWHKRPFCLSYWSYKTGFDYPSSLASSKCAAFDKDTTHCTGVFRNLNVLLPLENITV